MFGYLYPVWPAAPYLSVGGSMASGKSTVFRVLSRMVFRPLESSNMTAACLFRTLHDLGGVLLLDEAERLRDQTPDAGEIRSILLSGYKRGSPAMRLEKDGERFRRVAFDVYGPKAIAGISSLPEALASRCIRITMMRADADSPKPRRRLAEDPDRWVTIRDQLHALSLEHGRTWLDLSGRADVVPSSFAGREYEVWQPIMALATWLQERGAAGLTDVVEDFAGDVVASGQEDAAPEADELLLKLLAWHVTAGTSWTTKASDLLHEARERDQVTFTKWTPKGVANTLRRYGVETRKGHGNAGRTYSHVTVEALRKVEKAYGMDLGLPPLEDVPTCTERTDKPPF